MLKFARWALWISMAGSASAGCSAAQHEVHPTSPFTQALGRVFDDSVDYVQNVDGLGGRVAADWEAQIDALSTHSDLVAVARIETVIQGQDAEQARSYRLSAALTSVLRGDAPADSRVQLRVSEGQVGFNTVDGKEERLQSGRYVLFVKWYVDGAGDVRAHWHLTPYTDALIARVRRVSGLEDATLGQERVTRHDSPQP